MGLDVFAVLPGEDGGERPLAPEEAFRGVPPLAGGWFAEGGTGPYFRGAPYRRYVAAVTGRSLYQEYIPPEIVAEMAEKLDVAADAGRWQDFDLDEATARALAAWFRVCADSGFAVHAEW